MLYSCIHVAPLGVEGLTGGRGLTAIPPLTKNPIPSQPLVLRAHVALAMLFSFRRRAPQEFICRIII